MEATFGKPSPTETLGKGTTYDHHRILIKNLEFARVRTLGLLDNIEKDPDPQAVLAWRPGPGRAHIGWQLMHIAVTEEIFATERLAPREARAMEGTLAAVSRRQHARRQRALGGYDSRRVEVCREYLPETFRAIGDGRLDEVPEALRERKLTVRDVLFGCLA